MSARRVDDQVLVSRCVAGEDGAWRSLVGQHQERLRSCLAALLPRPLARAELVEDLAQQVWYALLERDRQRLRAYDAARCSLGTYLAVLARREVLRLRQQRRRQARAARRCERCPAEPAVPFCPLGVLLEDLFSCLTPREREYLEGHLLSLPPASQASGLSASNARKLKQRLLRKCRDASDRR